MKYFILLVFFCAVQVNSIWAKNSEVKLNKVFQVDSVNLYFDENYSFVETKCSQIIRYGNFNSSIKKYVGVFKDVNKSNPKIIVAQGSYNQAGQRDGFFVIRSLSGNLLARGGYKNGQAVGHWYFFYGNGNPKMEFDVQNGQVLVMSAWNDRGARTVTNGTGILRTDLGFITWEGYISNGLPEGTWKAVKANDPTGTIYISELFLKGKFQRGLESGAAYADRSRLQVVNYESFLVFRAEKLIRSVVPCGTPKQQTSGSYTYKPTVRALPSPKLNYDKPTIYIPKGNVISAKSPTGWNSFSLRIKQIIAIYLTSLNLQRYHSGMINFQGEVLESGRMGNWGYANSYRDYVTEGLIKEFSKLPILKPATVNGRPLRQKLIIHVKIDDQSFNYSYTFLPIQ